jgi:hypothetical protein
MKNMFMYETGIVKVGIRKWYNPLRWFKGKIYKKHVSLRRVFK